MDNPDLSEKLAALDRRLARLERLLGVKMALPEHLAAAPREPAVAHAPGDEMPASPVAATTLVSLVNGSTLVATPESSVEAPLETPELVEEVPPPRRVMPPPLPPHHSPAPQPVIEYPSASFPTPVKQSTLEQAIGLKWAGWIGAVVLVIGAAFGIKYCYDQGWFTFVTPAVRLAMLAMGGFALIAAGEWVYRKINRISAAGLFGAGVAVLFIVSYAGYAFYALYARNTAFAFMAASTVIGTLVARRGKMVSIAVLSMIGGNLAPALLRSDHPQLTGFLFYLLVLQLTSLALAAWGASPRWWTLRGLSLATTSLWAAGVFNLPPRQSLEIFVPLFAAFYQGELIYSAWRSKLSARTAGVTFSILVSAGCTTALLCLFPDVAVSSRLCMVLGLAGIVAAIGYACRKTSHDGSPLRALSVGFALQALALLVLAAPIAFSGIWISVSWCAVALLLAGAGYLLDQPMPRFGAIAVWVLAVGDLLLWTADPASNHNFQRIAFTLLGTAIPIYAVDGWVLALSAHLIAAIVRERRHNAVSIFLQVLAQGLSIAGTFTWILITIAALPMLASTAGLLALGWILLTAGLLDDELYLSVQAAGLFALATVKWAIVDTLIDRVSPDWSAGEHLPFLTPNIGVAALVIASLWMIHYLPRSPKQFLIAARKLLGSTVLALLVLMWAGTFEVDRIIRQYIPGGSMNLSANQWLQLSWTTWWMLGSCGHLLMLHWLSRGDRLRQAQMLNRIWIIPALLAIKYTLIDRLYFRMDGVTGSSSVLTGPEAVAGTIVLGGLILIYWLSYGPIDAKLISKSVRNWIVGLCLTQIFFMLTLGIDQAFANARSVNGTHAEQVTLSIVWAVYAIGLVIAGFIWRTAAMRYCGLALFGIVLLKVVTVDLSQVSTGYRILSFMGVGGLLLGTSVLYGKLSPKLLGEEAKPHL